MIPPMTNKHPRIERRTDPKQPNQNHTFLAKGITYEHAKDHFARLAGAAAWLAANLVYANLTVVRLVNLVSFTQKVPTLAPPMERIGTGTSPAIAADAATPVEHPAWPGRWGSICPA